MNEFYNSLSKQERSSAQGVALKYGRTLNTSYRHLVSAKTDSASPYYIGLTAEIGSFSHVTKRVTLVTDTMVLSDHGAGTVYELGVRGETADERTHRRRQEWTSAGQPLISFHRLNPFAWEEEGQRRRYGMVTHDLTELGQWLLDAEPLLRTGLAWYAPVFYSTSPAYMGQPVHQISSSPNREWLDFVVREGRAVDLSRTKPLASRVVRPILEIDLPFINGLSLRDFAQVTREEFDSYRQYRDFMRSRLLELDVALEGVDSQVALERVALSIRDEMNAATAEIRKATRFGALNRCGALLGTTSAVLTAIRPEALQNALSISATLAAGATGLWPTIQAFADIKSQPASGKWHYVWVLKKRSGQ